MTVESGSDATIEAAAAETGSPWGTGSRERGWLATLVFGAMVVVLVWHRLPYGVDFADESYTAAMAHRFAHGARPFVDELSPQQFSAFLLSPLVRLYESAAGGYDGLVLFLRRVNLILALLAALCVYRGARDHVSRELAVLVSLACVAYTPYNLACPSYDSITFLALTAGCFLAVARNSRTCLVAAGLCHALSAVVYQTLIVLPVSMVAVRLVRGGERMAIYPYLAGLVGVFVPAVAVALWIGTAQLHYVATLGFNAGYGHLATLDDAIQHLAHIGAWGSQLLRHTHRVLWVYGLVVLALARFQPTLARWTLCLLPAALDASLPHDDFTSTPLVIYSGLLLPPCLLLVWRKPAALYLFRHIGLPSLLCGAVIAYTSYNGLDNAPLGLFPACLLTSLCLAWFIGDGDGAVRRFKVMPQFLMVSLFLILTYGPPYNDLPLRQLTARVRTGGYAGLMTTPERELFLSRLASDVDKFGADHDTVMFYNDFPAGYLLTRLRCNAAMVWISQFSDRDSLLRYYGDHLPDLVVRMKRIPRIVTGPEFEVLYRAGDNLDRWLTEAYQQVLSTPDYDIYRLKARARL